MEFYCDCCGELTDVEDCEMVEGFGFVCEFCIDAAEEGCCGECEECK